MNERMEGECGKCMGSMWCSYDGCETVWCTITLLWDSILKEKSAYNLANLDNNCTQK